MFQHLLQRPHQKGEPAHITPLLRIGRGEQDIHRLVQIAATGALVLGIGPRQIRHFGETDILADHVLVHHPPIQAVQRLAPRHQTGGDARPCLVPRLFQQFAIGRQPPPALHQLVFALARLLHADRVRQTHRADRRLQLLQLGVQPRRPVTDQLARPDRVQRDHVHHQTQLLQPHEFMRQRVILGPDRRLGLLPLAQRFRVLPDRRRHRPAPQRRACGAADLHLGRVLLGQVDIEHPPLLGHARSSSRSQAAQTLPRNSS